jgi:type II secretory pathway component GspD/PulD (secretin)
VQLKKYNILFLRVGLLVVVTVFTAWASEPFLNIGQQVIPGFDRANSKLIPESSLDEEDIEEHEINQPISPLENVNVILQKIYHDPQLATKKITLHMKNADVKEVIGIIGKSIGIDFVIDSDVKGTLESVDLKEYDAGLALEYVCRRIKPEAAVIKLGDIWHVMPQEAAKKALADLFGKDQMYAVLPIRHASVDQQFGEKIKDIWKGIAHDDPSSHLNIDEDQKRVHIRGNRQAILELQRYIKEIDKPILQVRIDVVIVAARKDFTFEFGFDWSGMYNREQSIKNCNRRFSFYGLGGSPLDFPNPKDSTDRVTPSPIVPSPPNTNNPNLFVDPLNFAMNLFNSGVPFYTKDLVNRIVPGLIRVPFIFGGPDLAYKRLNVILNMAEIEEKISIISRPSILTSNNKVAKILIGQSLPLQTITTQTTSTTQSSDQSQLAYNTLTYKDTGIILEVRPLVNPDKKSVFLNILVEQSVIDSGTTRVNEKGIMTDPPVISVIKTKNEVVLRDGQTTIIGGLSSRENNSTKRSVPFLSRLPLFGELFKATFDTTKETERYIFITPKIVEYET